MDPYNLTLIIYNISLFPIMFFSILFIVLAFVNIFVERKEPVKHKKLTKLPFVSVQVPTFNDPIAVRCIQKCMKFDYPKDLYEIVIVDDSTDKETQALLKQFSIDHPGFIKYSHRENREGFKPGALKHAHKITKGEIIVIFDADWIPNKDFLIKVVQPFSDPKVAIVQTRQGFYNKDTNLITRFAAYLLMIYHTIMMPINNKINCVFFCGTAGALRRKPFEEVGGWNLHSITEDSDLSVNLLLRGYRSVYLDFETPSEVPDTFESFVKQQMRWCYGNVRVFFDNAFKIMFKKGLSIKQRLAISYITLGNIAAPLVVMMTFFGFGGWFLGEPSLMRFSDLVEFFVKFFYTAGFLFMGLIAFHKQKIIKEIGYLTASAFTVGLVLAIFNSLAFFKAAFNRKLHWYCTPKIDNVTVVK